MWLPWEAAVVLALALAVLGVAMRDTRHARWVTPCALEASLVSVLYAAWQFAGRWSLGFLEGALGRGQWLWDVERALYLPSEAWLQSLVLPHSWLVQASNIYYGGAHVPVMGVFLVWMFLRHRDRYARWRTVLAGTTAACLVVQLLPVAPPRFVGSLSMVDTGIEYGQSVYSAMGMSNAGQLQAMPSIHVAWAALVGVAVWTESPSRWRFLGPLHVVLTNLVVVVTANHYWADGLVAAAILWAVVAVDASLRRWSRRAQPVSPGRSDIEWTAAMSAAVEGSCVAAPAPAVSESMMGPARSLPSSTPH